jgi:hypothetical protein
MRSRILLVLSLATCLALVPALASGAPAKKTRALTGTLHMAVIGPNGDNGNVYAGELLGKPVPRSAVILRNTVEGSTSNSKAIAYAKRGTIRATSINQIEPQPDGSIKFPGTFKIVGGTGAYRGATGSGTLNGVLPAGSTVLEVKLDGKIHY